LQFLNYLTKKYLLNLCHFWYIYIGTAQFYNPKTGEKRRLAVDDPLVTNGIFAGLTKGKAPYRSKRSGRTLYLAKDDPRRTNGHWEPCSAGANKGRLQYINKQTGQIARMKADDIRLKDSNWTRFHRRLGIGLDYLH
jgi:hypothetical protein